MRADSDSEDDLASSALGVLGGPSLDGALGGLGSSAMRRGTRSASAESENPFENPFAPNARELERRNEPLGVGLGGVDDVSEDEEERVSAREGVRELSLRETEREPRLVERGTSPMTPDRAGALENGSYHANEGMTYGDLLAPPPSYADSVMYTQPEIQPAYQTMTNAGGTTIFLDGDDEDASKAMLKVWVSDPKIELDSSSALVGKRVTHYKVTTRTNIPSYIHKEVVVWRRFRDFVALDARLSALHRGYFIPPRPEKTVVNSTGENFVQERAVQLQQYLNRIASHAHLRLGDPLRIFLTHQDLGSSLDWFSMTSRIINPSSTGGVPNSPETPQRPPVVISSPGQPRDFGRFFKELRQTVVQSTAISAVGGALGLDTPKPKVMEEDAAFLVEKDRVTRIEQELSGMSSKATKLLTLQQKFGEALGEFGLECLKFAKLQEEEGTRLGKYSENGIGCMTAASEMRKAGNTSVRMSRVTRSATAQTAQALEPLHDYLKIMPSVRRSISDRNEALLTLQTMLAEADRLEARIAKSQFDTAKMKKVEEWKSELETTKATGEQAKADYETIQERHREEFARLEKERVADFHAMLLNFARVQVSNAERSLSLWRGLAEEFGASPDEWRTPEPEKAGETTEL